jgi:hypothetical protein
MSTSDLPTFHPSQCLNFQLHHTLMIEGITEEMSESDFRQACIHINDKLYDSNSSIQPHSLKVHICRKLSAEVWKGQIVETVDTAAGNTLFTVQWRTKNGELVMDDNEPQRLWSPKDCAVLRLELDTHEGRDDSHLVFSHRAMNVAFTAASSAATSRVASRAESPTNDAPALPKPQPKRQHTRAPSGQGSAVSVSASEAQGVSTGRIQALSEKVNNANAQLESLQAQVFSNADVCDSLTEKVRALNLDRVHARKSFDDLEADVLRFGKSFESHIEKTRAVFSTMQRKHDALESAVKDLHRRLSGLENARASAHRDIIDVDDEAQQRGYCDEMESDERRADRSALPPLLCAPRMIRQGFADRPNVHFVDTYPVTRDHPDRIRIREFILGLGRKSAESNELRHSVGKARSAAVKAFDDRVNACTKAVVEEKGAAASVELSPFSVIPETAFYYRKLCKAMRDLYIEVECAQAGASSNVTAAMKEKWDRNVANSGDDGGLNPFQHALSELKEREALEKPQRPPKATPAAAPAAQAPKKTPAPKSANKRPPRKDEDEGFRSGSDTE